MVEEIDLERSVPFNEPMQLTPRDWMTADLTGFARREPPFRRVAAEPLTLSPKHKSITPSSELSTRQNAFVNRRDWGQFVW
jgi:hypothetical protein